MKKRLPEFESEAAERDFWETHDSIEYLDWKKAKRMGLLNLKLSPQTVSPRTKAIRPR